MSAVAATGALTSAAKPEAKPAGTLDQAAFLKLLTKQMTTQDPFDPVDNTQMIAQMAQFSSVAGIAEMNASLKSIASQIGGARIGDAASWIGRTALVTSDLAAQLPDGGYAGEIVLPVDADSVNVRLVDAGGAIVHAENLGARKAGSLSFEWPNRDAAGAPIASGSLRLLVEARAAGEPVTASTQTWTPISAVQSPAGGGATRLVTPLGLIAPEDAIRLG